MNDALKELQSIMAEPNKRARMEMFDDWRSRRVRHFENHLEVDEHMLMLEKGRVEGVLEHMMIRIARDLGVQLFQENMLDGRKTPSMHAFKTQYSLKVTVIS